MEIFNKNNFLFKWKFKKFGNYNDTTVDIIIKNIPYRNLHKIAEVPSLIHESYWTEVRLQSKYPLKKRIYKFDKSRRMGGDNSFPDVKITIEKTEELL